MDHRVDVIYRALSGWMSIEIDGQQCKRGWREWQTVFGGAVLSCDIDGHRVEARITQPFQQQVYSFKLKIDDAVQPGSDPQPEPGNLKRQTLIAIGWLTLSITIVIVGMRVLGAMG
ncbi:MAG TPA: hypothetical protein VM408_09525 [Methylomirabilota bacterium]|nr:hypothetical protein [Methylomirabilota bacterium]